METLIQPGLPVEIGRIDKELGKLWESSDDTKTRASLINFGIYTERLESVQKDTAIVAEIAGHHACRALLILANPKSSSNEARAWISAHCHLTGKSGRQICSEQITFQLDGEAAEALPNIVFSHLDSDLPLCFWWQEDFREPLDEKLWSWVDRLLFDSTTWSKPGPQFDLTRRIACLSDAKIVLCDLNWTRLHSCRFALASIFDHAAALPCLENLHHVKIVCAHRVSALLLLGWLAAQLNWTLQSLLSRDFFVTRDGRQVSFEIQEKEGSFISEVILQAGESSFELTRPEGSDFFHANIRASGIEDSISTLHAGREAIADVLLAELSRGGRHPIYWKAVGIVSPLFQR